jgi:hypothetical protein
MRKFLISLIAVSALFAMTAGLASSATNARSAAATPPKCSPSSTSPLAIYLPPCKAPTVGAASLVSCQQTGKTLHFPISAHANAGLRSALVRFRGKTIKKKTFPSHPINAHFTATLSTRGFKPGLFTLTATATDVRGKKASRSVHFTICKPKPVFTG